MNGDKVENGERFSYFSSYYFYYFRITLGMQVLCQHALIMQERKNFYVAAMNNGGSLGERRKV